MNKLTSNREYRSVLHNYFEKRESPVNIGIPTIQYPNLIPKMLGNPLQMNKLKGLPQHDQRELNSARSKSDDGEEELISSLSISEDDMFSKISLDELSICENHSQCSETFSVKKKHTHATIDSSPKIDNIEIAEDIQLFEGDTEVINPFIKTETVKKDLLLSIPFNDSDEAIPPKKVSNQEGLVSDCSDYGIFFE